MYTPQQIAQGLQAQQRMQMPMMPQQPQQIMPQQNTLQSMPQGQIPMSMQRQPQGGVLRRSVPMPQNLQVR